MTKLKFSHVSTGFIAVFIGYASAAAIIFQAATSAGATEEQVASWFWALGIGMGVTTILLSFHYKKPVVTAWSTPGAALLITSLEGLTMNQAVAVFLFSSMLITLVGLAGIFEKVLKQIPTSIASAMLAGILLQFGLGLFTSLMEEAQVVAVMLAVFILAKARLGNLLIPSIFIIALVMCVGFGKLDVSQVTMGLTTPVFITPDFEFFSLFSVGIPLFIVTMASQNLPGFAVLKANGYQVDSSKIITTTGVTGLIFAPFGGFAYNLAAITGAICMGPNADSNPNTRYMAGISMGVFYLLAGVMGMSFVSLFSAVPSEIVIAVAGLAVMPTLMNCLAVSMADSHYREPALLTFLFTASGTNLLGIGSAFWGLCIGLFCCWLHNYKAKSRGASEASQTSP
ncbi:benzoate/H(+) symporter BenE family transporter [Vibrio gigantis]|uniref:benzoate/H(+) symporter BenE family transporter n=1 Tax=Vibrio TaxID=662 RepID=UPI001EFB102A|nr:MULTISPECIES: benzoate/H(+) symporter BenE family transporter [Vibrio]MDL5027449.1 benzoate/H(+) symporter BenE family transporter [Vibrio sp. TMPB1044]MDN5207577.1 benzoate/H(+) symporter BenE family transporter [Vibrio sp. TMPB1044]ULN66939.1 benzoate/H(+) symporter BenE family transporter [Vibrio gigantis]